VIAALRTPARRISFAIALSSMLHAAILCLPHRQPPHEKVHLPPLTARLELLPKSIAQPPTKPEPVKQADKPEVSTLGKPGGSMPVKLVDSTPDKPISNAVDTMKEMEKSAATHQFPKHLLLTFAVYKGADASRVGELLHQLDINSDRYTLKATRQAGGLTSLVNNEQLIQTSYGKIDAHGLQPETFNEEKITGSGKQGLEITFDWVTQKLLFSHGGDTVLPADAQDILSFMYQLSQLSMHREIIPLPVSDGTQLEQVQIEIGSTEDIDTPMGKLRALHLRKMHAQGKRYFEIWLGLEYRLLPVKFRQIDGSGEVIEEFVISDIRAAEL